MSAWACANAGHNVQLFERAALMSATSAASTKLLHGGLRYLESREFSLVRESLHERAWWLKNAPEFTQPIRLYLPIVQDGTRSAWFIRLGMTLYDILAGRANIERHRSYDRTQFIAATPDLKPARIRGGFQFVDVQMDDYSLGLWAAQKARKAGVRIYDSTDVKAIGLDGVVRTETEAFQFDAVVNAAGPWAESLLRASGIPSQFRLDLVRGSHLILSRPIERGYVLEHPDDGRVCFVLPWKGRTLVGSTEVRQKLVSPVSCTIEEEVYLLTLYNEYFKQGATPNDVESTFAGVRPLVLSDVAPNKESRKYVLERVARVVTVFGGKWTTSRLLGIDVERTIRESVSLP